MKKLMIALATSACAASAAYGQVIPPGVGVADRARPELDPIGGRVGSFILYPRLELNESFTDNLRATNTNRVSNAFTELAGELRIVSDLPRHSANFRVYGNRSFHPSYGSEDTDAFGAAADVRLDLSRLMQVTTSVTAERLTADRRSYENIQNARSPIRYGHLYGYFSIAQDLSPVEITEGVVVDKYDYHDQRSTTGALLSQRYRDVTVLSGNVTVAYSFRPGLAAVISGEANRRYYPLSAASPLQPGNLDRASSGYRIEGGVKLDITSLLYGEVRVGYLSQQYRDSRFRDVAGLSFTGDLLWNVTTLTSLRFRAQRQVVDTSSTVAAGERVTEFSVRADHELLRNLILNAQMRYAHISPLGPVLASDEYGGSVGGRYFANRRLSFNAGYEYSKRSSPTASYRFNENRLTVGARLTF